MKTNTLFNSLFNPKLLALAVITASMTLAGCGDNDSSSDGTETKTETKSENSTETKSETTPETAADTKTDTSDQPAAKTVTLTGKAATGAALKGTVEAVNANGEKADPVTVAKDGSYSIKVPEGAPYMLKATSTDLKGADGKPLELFSYSEKGGIANITTLTTQALYSASNKGNLKTAFGDWTNYTNSITAEKVTEASKIVLANLKDTFVKAGVTDNPDIFTADFKTDGTGIDKVLDSFKARYTCESANSCTALYQVDGKAYTWKDVINAINTAEKGLWILVRETTTYSNDGNVKSWSKSKTTASKDFPIPKDEATACGSLLVIKGDSCSFDGKVRTSQRTTTLKTSKIITVDKDIYGDADPKVNFTVPKDLAFKGNTIEGQSYIDNIQVSANKSLLPISSKLPESEAKFCESISVAKFAKNYKLIECSLNGTAGKYEYTHSDNKRQVFTYTYVK